MEEEEVRKWGGAGGGRSGREREWNVVPTT